MVSLSANVPVKNVVSLSANLPALLSANLPVLLSANFVLISVRAASLKCVHTSRTTPTPKLHSSLSQMSSQVPAGRISTGGFCNLFIHFTVWKSTSISDSAV